MSLTVFFAVLAAALLHASWNALLKLGESKLTGMMILSSLQGLMGLFVALSLPTPGAEVWPWLLASGLLHSSYKAFLTFAYEQGDLSRVYPIARGAAPMIVLAVTLAFLGEQVAPLEIAGIVVLGIGILAMARGIFTNGESRRMLPFALGSAMATAGYSLVDGYGARVEGHADAFVAWMFAIDGLIFGTGVLAWRGTVVLRATRRGWVLGGLAAAASYGAYAVAVWAMTQAPVALVTALRETSIMFAVLIGWLVFDERMDRAKATAAVLIVAGVVLTRL